VKKSAPYVATYLTSLLLCLPMATSCAALGWQPLPNPNPHARGAPVCGGVTLVLIDINLSHDWVVRIREEAERWNAVIGQRLLYVSGVYDFEEMYANGEMGRRNPYITIHKIGLEREIEYRKMAVEEARRLGRPVHHLGAVSYVHYGMEGTLQACVRGTRIEVYEDDGFRSDQVLRFQIAHELGHALGLGIRSRSREMGTLMYPVMRIDEYGELRSSFELGADTMRELRSLYPRYDEDIDSAAAEQ